MPSFKPAIEVVTPKQDVNPTPGNSHEIKSHNIKMIEISESQTITAFVSSSIRPGGPSPSYGAVRKTFVNTEDHKNNRFHLSELAKSHLSVQQEEEIRIEAEVQRRTASKISEIEERARRQAHEEGFQKGVEEGKSHIENEMKPEVEKIGLLLKDLQNAAAIVAAQNEELLIKIVQQIAKRIAFKEIATDGDFVKRAIIAVLNRLDTKDNVKIILSKETQKVADKLKADLALSLGELRNLTIEFDSTLNSSEFKVESDFGNVDATLDSQMNMIKEVFNG